MKVIRALRNSVADVNAPVTQGGYTHLMLASLSGSNAPAAWLIEYRADANAAIRTSCRSMIAAIGNHLSIAELLLRSGGRQRTQRGQPHRTHHPVPTYPSRYRRPCDRIGLVSESR